MTMKIFNLYLEESELKRYKRQAALENISTSEYIRKQLKGRHTKIVNGLDVNDVFDEDAEQQQREQQAKRSKKEKLVEELTELVKEIKNKLEEPDDTAKELL